MLKGIDFYQTDKESFAIVKDGSGFGNLLWCDAYSSILGTLGRLSNNEFSDLKFCYYLTLLLNLRDICQGVLFLTYITMIMAILNLRFPPLPEQQKIAAILSEADAKIEKEQTKKHS